MECENLDKNEVTISEVIGGGYDDFWKYKGRYRVCKGSRASKKSKTTALNFIVRIMESKLSNLLVLRKTYRTLKDSCFTELQWGINRLGVGEFWRVCENPLEMTYLPTGQRIYFRGLDDPMKITSITVKYGYLCWLWIEEAYEISSEADFDMVDESIRGSLPANLYKQITITFNPWNEGHWLKRRFFDIEDNDILAKTTNYLCNEFLDNEDYKVFERMKLTNPRRYQVAGLGNWGIAEGLVYENWIEYNFDIDEIKNRKGIKSVFGLDFGYTNDETALFCGLVDRVNREIYVFDEIYKRSMSNRVIYEEILKRGYVKERIRADSAEPKSIDELRELGVINIKKAKKGKDSINNGIQFVQDFKIIINPRCNNYITEISNYSWERDNLGNRTNRPMDSFNHLMDAMRYALEELNSGDTFSFD